MRRYHRCAMSICLGSDRRWGDHISDLMFRAYGLRGSVYFDVDEWRFYSSSSRVFKDLSLYYNPEWNARTWRLSPLLFHSSEEARRGLVRGYFDADGYPHFSKARARASVQVNSVNLNGLQDMRDLLRTLGFSPGLYRRYKIQEVWELSVQRSSEVIRFFDEIGFSIKRKQVRLKELLMRDKLVKD